MLESMSAMQYREWLAFFKIRHDREKDGASREEQQQLSGKIFKAMAGYQQRRDKLKGK